MNPSCFFHEETKLVVALVGNHYSLQTTSSKLLWSSKTFHVASVSTQFLTFSFYPIALTWGGRETLGWLKSVVLLEDLRLCPLLTLWWTNGPDSVSCKTEVHITASDRNHGPGC